jgi:hypothetical protein
LRRCQERMFEPSLDFVPPRQDLKEVAESFLVPFVTGHENIVG